MIPKCAGELTTIVSSTHCGSATPVVAAANSVSLLVVIGMVLLVGFFAASAPIGCKILAVMLLAGPHNWIELRYFLSRLPARYPGRTATFFQVSAAGLLAAAAGYIPLMLGVYSGALEWHLARNLYSVWGAGVCLWTATLVWLSQDLWRGFNERSRHTKPLRLAITMVLIGAAFYASLQPIYFGIALVFLHPLLSLAILDRELARSRPQWLSRYRACLLMVPVVVASFWLCLHDLHFPATGAVASHIVDQTGAQAINWAGSYFLLSTLVFLDLLHYAVWLIVVPNWAGGWTRWHPASVPLAARFPKLKPGFAVVFGGASVLVLALWIGFAGNYVATSQLYFVFAIVHVLAEIPFLVWSSR